MRSHALINWPYPWGSKNIWGAPKVRVYELVGVDGFTWNELLGLLGGDTSITPEASLDPANKTWPTGFAWSSFVAQSCMISSCVKGGYRNEQCITDAYRIPDDTSDVVAAAANDVAMFIIGEEHTGYSLSQERVACMKKAWHSMGVVDHADKSSCWVE